MNHYSRSPQIVIALAAALALFTTAPFVQAQLDQRMGETFVVQIQNGELLELKADRILHQPNRFISLVRDGETVAAFTYHQVLYVVRKAAHADHLFEVQSHDGKTTEFRADKMRLDPNGFIELTIDGELSGVVGANSRYVRRLEEGSN